MTDDALLWETLKSLMPECCGEHMSPGALPGLGVPTVVCLICSTVHVVDWEFADGKVEEARRLLANGQN
jgi:hypothetical protein